jgi:hypothetical protein
MRPEVLSPSRYCGQLFMFFNSFFLPKVGFIKHAYFSCSIVKTLCWQHWRIYEQGGLLWKQLQHIAFLAQLCMWKLEHKALALLSRDRNTLVREYKQQSKLLPVSWLCCSQHFFFFVLLATSSCLERYDFVLSLIMKTDEYCCLLRCVMWFSKCRVLFWRNIMPPSSGSYSTPERNFTLLTYYVWIINFAFWIVCPLSHSLLIFEFIKLLNIFQCLNCFQKPHTIQLFYGQTIHSQMNPCPICTVQNSHSTHSLSQKPPSIFLSAVML